MLEVLRIFYAKILGMKNAVHSTKTILQDSCCLALEVTISPQIQPAQHYITQRHYVPLTGLFYQRR